MEKDALGVFELQVMSVLIDAPKGSYGAEIQTTISVRTQRDVSVGAIHVTLDRLEKKRLISSKWGEPTAERGGRRKRYYKIEAAGLKAFAHTCSLFETRRRLVEV